MAQPLTRRSTARFLRYLTTWWLLGLVPGVPACAGGTRPAPTGLDAHQSWRAGYEAARHDYQGVFVPRSIQQQLAGASTEQWCTQELSTYKQTVNAGEFVKGCVAYTAGEATQ